MTDRIHRMIVTDAPFRCVIVWMPETAQTILSQHNPSPAMGEYLANAANSALLLASNLKGKGAVSLRFETSGAIGIMNADGTPDGLVRAMIVKANVDDEETSRKLRLPMVGPGILTVTRTLNDRQPYHGICEIKSPHIGPIIAEYLLTSEQTHSSVGVATGFDSDGRVSRCCGFLVEAFPEASDQALARMEENIRSIGSFREFALQIERPEEIAEEILKGFKSENLMTLPVAFHCPCSRERVLKAILAAGEKEAGEMAAGTEDLEVFCDYCRKRYVILPSEITAFRSL